MGKRSYGGYITEVVEPEYQIGPEVEGCMPRMIKVLIWTYGSKVDLDLESRGMHADNIMRSNYLAHTFIPLVPHMSYGRK